MFINSTSNYTGNEFLLQLEGSETPRCRKIAKTFAHFMFDVLHGKNATVELTDSVKLEIRTSYSVAMMANIYGIPLVKHVIGESSEITDMINAIDK